MAIKKYEARFSDGKVLTRKSEREYKTAWLSRDYSSSPPRIMGHGFSSDLHPSGIRYSYGAMAHLSSNERSIQKRKLEKKNEHVRTEVVKVRVIK